MANEPAHDHKVGASIAAQNTFSNGVLLTRGFSLSLSGTWVATVFVQRSFDEGNAWVDVESFTSNGEYVGYEPEEGIYYRFGCKTGGYTSGTVVGRLAQ